MIQGHVGDSGLPRNPDSVVAEMAHLVFIIVWVTQIGLRCERIECIDVPGG